MKDDDDRREEKPENHGKIRKMFVKMWNIPLQWIRHTSIFFYFFFLSLASTVLLFVSWMSCVEWVDWSAICLLTSLLSAEGRNVDLSLTFYFFFFFFLPFFFFALIIFNLDDSCVWSVWIIISTLTYNFIWERENVPYELMMIAWRNFIQFILEF